MKQRKFRTKVSHDDDDDSSAPKNTAASSAPKVVAIASASVAAAKLAVKSSGSKPSLLSFGAEAEDDGPLSMAASKSKKEKERKPKMGRAQGLPELPSVETATQRSAAGASARLHARQCSYACFP